MCFTQGKVSGFLTREISSRKKTFKNNDVKVGTQHALLESWKSRIKYDFNNN